MSSSALVIAGFHEIFYNSGQWVNNTQWMGVPVQKCPLDLWVYQEIIHEVKPRLIIETGTYLGGSALFMAQMCELALGACNRALVVTVDIGEVPADRPRHWSIRYMNGLPSTDLKILGAMQPYVNVETNRPVMVVLDSDHSKNYVLEEMRAYAPFVTVGSYLIVEDTNMNGHPVCREHGPGPFEAVEEFLAENHDFAVDHTREKFMLTQNPNGYLRRMQ